jgi:hypothetical protein
VVQGSDTITLHVSGDNYQGDPQFTVTVDGKQVGGTQSVTADHASGQWQDITLSGSFTAGSHQVAINFINDANDGTSWTTPDGHDRNMYVGYVDVDGQRYQGNTFTDPASDGFTNVDPNAAVMVSNGSASFTATISAVTTGTTVALDTSPQQLTATPGETFVFKSMGAAGSTIDGFTPGQEHLDLHQLLQSVGYAGTNPVGDGYLTLADSGADALILVDPDGHGPGVPHLLVTLHGVHAEALKAGVDYLV